MCLCVCVRVCVCVCVTQVIGGDNEESRLLLSEATARVIRQCFGLLGITPLYRI